MIQPINHENHPNGAGSPVPVCSARRERALDVAEQMRIFRLRYDAALERGENEAAEAIEELFHSFWNGSCGQYTTPWYVLFGLSQSDGSKVLMQEPPFYSMWDWVRENIS